MSSCCRIVAVSTHSPRDSVVNRLTFDSIEVDGGAREKYGAATCAYVRFEINNLRIGVDCANRGIIRAMRVARLEVGSTLDMLEKVLSSKAFSGAD